MSDDLIAWLRAQLDEDERVAREVPSGLRAWQTAGGWPEHCPTEVKSADTLIVEDDSDLCVLTLPHIARHDPARVLAEVEAKRRIVDLHVVEVVRTERMPFDPFTGERQEGYAVSVMCELCGWVGEDETTACNTVRLLALPYADRPGYREEWRP